MSIAAAPAVRRTQAERRATTRGALLDAAVASLVAVGYARTTTTEVCKRAGVSQGALFKYFPTKEALVSAAAAHLLDGLVGGYLDAFTRIPRGSDRATTAIRLMWSVFCRPELSAAFDLYLAARGDEGLARCLAPVIDRHARTLRTEARRLFPEVGGTPRFEALLDLLLELMQGMALSRAISLDPAHERRVLGLATELARAAIDGESTNGAAAASGRRARNATTPPRRRRRTGE